MHRIAAATVALALVAGCSWRGDVGDPVARAAEAQSSRILAHDGTLITTLHAEEDREAVPLDRISPTLRDAVVAIEDRRFWEHEGVDLRALLRAAVEDARAGRLVEGGSTITQQFVKNALLEPDRTLHRKVREASLAYRLERSWSKDEILEGYLNTIYFGNGAYGAEAAARVYFDKPAAELTLSEAALLAGMIRSPGRYDPYRSPEAARARRDLVLSTMRGEGLIAGAQVDEAKGTELGVGAGPVTRSRYPAAHFVEAVKQQILDDPTFGETRDEREAALFTGGLRIRTTLDLAEQAAAEDAVAKVLSQPARDPEAALVSIEPSSGAVRALVGGRDFFGEAPNAKFDLATQSGRQAGSAFKPLVLATALQEGMPLTRTYPAPSRVTIPMPGQPAWEVDNYEGEGGGRLDLVEATVASVNTVYARLVLDVGPQDAVATAARMGVRSPLQPFPSAVLGTNDVTPLDLATAYGTLANRGLRVDPVLVTGVTAPDGKVLLSRRPPAGTRALRRDVADAVTGVLQQVVERGTGVAARIGRPVAGKTGTGQQWRDAWFVGFTPERVAAVWVGFPAAQRSMVPPLTRIRVTGGSWPAQVWQLFMSAALAQVPVTPFPASAAATAGGTIVPDGLGTRVEDVTQLLRLAGFEVRQVGVPDRERPPGWVVAQEPAAGTKVARGARVTVHVTTRAIEVPDVLGLTADRARAVLARAGLEARVVVEDEPPSVEAAQRRGLVWRQRPAAGSDVAEGDTVTVSVNPRG